MHETPSKRLNVLILGNLAPYCVGGAEVQARLMAQALARRGHRVSAAGFANPDGHITAGADSRARIKTYGLRTIRVNRLTRAVSYFLSLSVFLLNHRHQFDLIFCNMLGESDVVVALLKHLKLLDLPMVACTASFGGTGDAKKLQSLPFATLVARLVKTHCAVINILCPRIEKELVEMGFDPDRFTHIPNGVTFGDARLGPDRYAAGKRTFLFAGRFIELKGVADLLQALRILKDRGITAALNLTGEGPLEDALRGRVDELGLGGHVRFLGKVAPAKMETVYLANTILVVPSHREAFGMVVVEAMSHGMPVIATRSGGPEFIVDARSGLLCPPRDPEALAAAMQTLVEMPADALGRMGAAGRQRVEACFDIEHVVDRYVALFHRLACIPDDVD